MSTPILDPRLPADNSPLVSGEMRGQFQAIQNRACPTPQNPAARLTESTLLHKVGKSDNGTLNYCNVSPPISNSIKSFMC
jgi:hypothetical protein